MRFLLDTQAFLWFVWDHPSLSERARALMADPGSDLLLSAGSLWEIAIKSSLGKLVLATHFEPFATRALAQNDILLLPLSLPHLGRVAALPFHHRDPFDRLLAAQALVEDLPLISVDGVFEAYGVERIW